MSVILEINKLSKHFSGLVAVNDLSIAVEARRIHSLIGPNGSGKTTTVNMITGTFPPSGGQVLFRGRDITAKKPYDVAREGISRTFQNIKLYNSMTVLENMLVGGHMNTGIGLGRFIFDFAGAAREERQLRSQAEEVLNFVGRYGVRGEYVSNLSYGKQKLTEFGRALMSRPSLLLLDEPAAGLHPAERAEFVDMVLKTYETGVDIFMIEHNMDVVMNISSKITVINFGVKIAEGSPEEIQNDAEVIKAYLGEQYQKTTRGGGV